MISTGTKSRTQKVTDTASFIEKARRVHGDRYDYTKVNYKRAKDLVTVICREHGEFQAVASNHLNGSHCRRCYHKQRGDAARLTQSVVIERFRSVYGDRYDYSQFEYKGATTKSVVVCPEHGAFETHYARHYHNRVGCGMCFEEIRGQGIKRPEHARSCKTTCPRLSLDDFVEQAKSVHGGKYNYSWVEWRGVTKAVNIICPRHGVFEQSPRKHLNGQGCRACSVKASSKSQRTTLESFATAARYHFRLRDKWIGGKTYVSFMCPEHGEFTQRAAKHLSGQGCPACQASNGESLIRKWLTDRDVPFDTQKTFDALKHQKRLRVDFWLPQTQCAIEFDGDQHFRPVEYFGGVLAFIRRQHMDRIKDAFFERHSAATLVRIRDTSNIDATLRRVT